MRTLRNKIQNKGITLIALVITIIVLLILAGVSIATLTGENGILTKVNDAKREAEKAEAREKIQLEMLASVDETGKYNFNKALENLEKNLGLTELNGAVTRNADGSLTVKLNGYEFPVSTEGVVGEGKETTGDSGEEPEPDSGEEPEPEGPITDYVQVGQYVDYEPTKIDVNKTQAVESSKLTYTSPVGTIPTDSTGIITHGNGDSEQTFTAKVNDGTETGIKWRVLSVSEDKVELISDTVVKTDANTNFILYGGIGYLYAEQELNEVCKIYGYGYGADTSRVTTYIVGGPKDTLVSGEIIGSGARSVTIEDLNKKAGIYEDGDGKMRNSEGYEISQDYGSTIYPTTAVYYPTLNSTNTTYLGQSESTKTGFKNTKYSWKKDHITDTELQNMLFNENYLLASRWCSPRATIAELGICYVNDGEIDQGTLNIASKNSLGQRRVNEYPIRPVITLKSDVIDLNTDYDAEGEWKLK